VPLWRHPEVLRLEVPESYASPWIRGPRLNAMAPQHVPVIFEQPSVPCFAEPIYSQNRSCYEMNELVSLGDAGRRMLKELSINSSKIDADRQIIPHYPVSYLYPSPYQIPVIPLVSPAAPYPVSNIYHNFRIPSSTSSQTNDLNSTQVSKGAYSEENDIPFKVPVKDDIARSDKNRVVRKKSDIEIECLKTDGVIPEALSNLSDDEVLDVTPKSRTDMRHGPQTDSVRVKTNHEMSIKQLKSFLAVEDDDSSDKLYHEFDTSGMYEHDEDVPDDFNEQNYIEEEHNQKFERDVSKNVILEEDEGEEEIPNPTGYPQWQQPPLNPAFELDKPYEYNMYSGRAMEEHLGRPTGKINSRGMQQAPFEEKAHQRTLLNNENDRTKQEIRQRGSEPQYSNLNTTGERNVEMRKYSPEQVPSSEIDGNPSIRNASLQQRPFREHPALGKVELDNQRYDRGIEPAYPPESHEYISNDNRTHSTNYAPQERQLRHQKDVFPDENCKTFPSSLAEPNTMQRSQPSNRQTDDLPSQYHAIDKNRVQQEQPHEYNLPDSNRFEDKENQKISSGKNYSVQSRQQSPHSGDPLGSGFDENPNNYPSHNEVGHTSDQQLNYFSGEPEHYEENNSNQSNLQHEYHAKYQQGEIYQQRQPEYLEDKNFEESHPQQGHHPEQHSEWVEGEIPNSSYHEQKYSHPELQSEYPDPSQQQQEGHPEPYPAYTESGMPNPSQQHQEYYHSEFKPEYEEGKIPNPSYQQQEYYHPRVQSDYQEGEIDNPTHHQQEYYHHEQQPELRDDINSDPSHPQEEHRQYIEGEMSNPSHQRQEYHSELQPEYRDGEIPNSSGQQQEYYHHEQQPKYLDDINPDLSHAHEEHPQYIEGGMTNPSHERLGYYRPEVQPEYQEGDIPNPPHPQQEYYHHEQQPDYLDDNGLGLTHHPREYNKNEQQYSNYQVGDNISRHDYGEENQEMSSAQAQVSPGRNSEEYNRITLTNQKISDDGTTNLVSLSPENDKRPKKSERSPEVSAVKKVSPKKSSVINQLVDSESESYQLEHPDNVDDSDFDFSIGK